MAESSSIEWTDATWNPVTGCAIVSPGCTNCYAMRLAGTRLAHLPSRAGLTRDSKVGPIWTGEIRFNAEWLDQPLRWRRPRRIFVCAHGDLFADGVKDEWIDQIFAVMALAPQHTFQVLTKRPERMRAYMLEQWQGTPARTISLGHGETLHIPAGGPTGRRCQIEEACEPLLERFGLVDTTKDYLWTEEGSCKAMQWQWPLPNVWLGVSAEDQRRADERIPDLLATPAALRFISAEPLLGPIRFRGTSPDGKRQWDWLTGETGVMHDDGPDFDVGPKLDWMIVGGESGQGARPMHPDWARQIRDACADAGAAFFFKQWGEWLFETQIEDGQHPSDRFFNCDGNPIDEKPPFGPHAGRLWHWWEPSHHASIRLGKKAAGRLLDGAEHSAKPEMRHG